MRPLQPPPKEASAQGKKKNTARWCKGKPGVKHAFKTIRWAERRNAINVSSSGFMDDWTLDLCLTCGKQTHWKWVGDADARKNRVLPESEER